MGPPEICTAVIVRTAHVDPHIGPRDVHYPAISGREGERRVAQLAGLWHECTDDWCQSQLRGGLEGASPAISTSSSVSRRDRADGARL